MYSLTQLNDYSNNTLKFQDERPAGYDTNPSNVANLPLSIVIGTEGDTHPIPLPFTIGNLTSINMTYTINTRPYTGGTVTWNSFPGNIQLSIPTQGVYRLTNIETQSEWDAVKQPNIFLGPDTSGNLTYTANLKPDANATPISWTINAQLADTNEINTGVLTSFFYDQDEVKQFNSGLLVTDTNPSGTYSIFISKSDNAAGNITSAGSGGTSTTSGQGNLTIAGTKSQVNSRLGNIIFTPANGYASNFTISYAVTNISGNVTNTATQLLKIGNINNGITDMYFTREYLSNQSSLLFPNTIPFLSETVVSNAAYSISFTLTHAIGFLAQTNDFINRTGWDQNFLTYTFNGSIDQCNDAIENLKFYPNKNESSNTTITYTQRKNGFFQLSTTFGLDGVYSDTAPSGTGLVTVLGGNTIDLRDYLTYERIYLLRCEALLVSGGGVRNTTTRTFNMSGTPIGSFVPTYEIRAYPGAPGGGSYYYSSDFNLRTLTGYTITIGAVGQASNWVGVVSLPPGQAGQAATTTASFGGDIDPNIYHTSTVDSRVAAITNTNGGGGTSGTNKLGGIAVDWVFRDTAGWLASAAGGGASSSARTNGPGGLTNAGGRPFFTGAFSQGIGGPGVTFDISGSLIEYCRGHDGHGVSRQFSAAPQGSGSGGRDGILHLKFTDPSPMPPLSSFGNLTLTSNSAAYFAGNTSSYLSGGQGLNRTIGSGPFTLEFWIYPTVTSSDQGFIWDSRAAGGFAVRYEGTDQMLLIHSGSSTAITWTRTNNTWKHVAIVRNQGVFRIYVQGYEVASTGAGGTNTYNGTTWRIGQAFDSTSTTTTLKGYIDEIRLSNVARYNGTFLTSNSPFTSDVNTFLLLQFDTGAGGAFIDSGPAAQTVTTNGNVVIVSVPN